MLRTFKEEANIKPGLTPNDENVQSSGFRVGPKLVTLNPELMNRQTIF
jgi:hypothetical protein